MIKNISFKLFVSVMKEGKAPANIKGITLDTEDNTGDLVPLEKLMTLEAVALLNKKHVNPKAYVEIGVDAEEYYKSKGEKH